MARTPYHDDGSNAEDIYQHGSGNPKYAEVIPMPPTGNKASTSVQWGSYERTVKGGKGAIKHGTMPVK